jgi:hypothetical protein
MISAEEADPVDEEESMRIGSRTRLVEHSSSGG